MSDVTCGPRPSLQKEGLNAGFLPVSFESVSMCIDFDMSVGGHVSGFRTPPRRKTMHRHHPLWSLFATQAIEFLDSWIEKNIIVAGQQSTSDDDAFICSRTVLVCLPQGKQSLRSPLPPDRPPMFMVTLASEGIIRNATLQERVFRIDMKDQ